MGSRFIFEEKADETVGPPTPIRGMLCLSLVSRFAFVYTRVISDRFPIHRRNKKGKKREEEEEEEDIPGEIQRVC